MLQKFQIIWQNMNICSNSQNNNSVRFATNLSIATCSVGCCVRYLFSRFIYPPQSPKLACDTKFQIVWQNMRVSVSFLQHVSRWMRYYVMKCSIQRNTKLQISVFCYQSQYCKCVRAELKQLYSLTRNTMLEYC